MLLVGVAVLFVWLNFILILIEMGDSVRSHRNFHLVILRNDANKSVPIFRGL